MSLVKCRDSRAVNSITSASMRLKVSALCKSLYMAMENLLRWFMDGDAGEDKEDSLASFSQLLLA